MLGEWAWGIQGRAGMDTGARNSAKWKTSGSPDNARLDH